MADYSSIQEIPSIEDIEATPTTLRPKFALERKLVVDIEKDISSQVSILSSKSSPELKRCSLLCPPDRSIPFFYESQLDKIIQKSSRTTNEAVLVYKNLKNFEFFKKFKEEHSKTLRCNDALVHLCRVMKYETFAAGTVIYRKDDDFDGKVYLVFSGEVAAATPNQLGTGASSLFSRKNKTTKSVILSGQDDGNKKERVMKKLLTRKLGNEGWEASPKNISRKPIGKAKSPKNNKLDFGEVNRLKNDFIKIPMEYSNQTLAGIKMKGSFKAGPKRHLTIEGSEGIKMHKVHSRIESVDELTDPRAAIREEIFCEKKEEEPIKVSIVVESVEPEIRKDPLPRRKLIKAKSIGAIESSQPGENKANVRRTDFKERERRSLKVEKSYVEVDKDIILKKEGQERDSPNNNNSGLPGKASENFHISLRTKSSSYVEENSNKSMESCPEEENIQDKSSLIASIVSIEASIQNNAEDSSAKESNAMRRGKTFGDKALHAEDPKRKETLIATVFTKVLTFTSSDYDYITTRFEKTNTKRLNFLLDHIPELEKAIKYNKLKNVDSHFEEQEFGLHNNIITEGGKGKVVYILYEGVCKVLKDPYTPWDLCTQTGEVHRKRNETADVLMCLIQPGVFFGEEILFNDSKHYQYTVKASSAVIKVLTIKKELFKRIMPNDVLRSLNVLYEDKRKHNELILARKLKASSTMNLPKKSLMRKLGPMNTPSDLMRSLSTTKDSQTQESFRDLSRQTPSITTMQESLKCLLSIPDEYRSRTFNLTHQKTSSLQGTPKCSRNTSQEDITIPTESQIERGIPKCSIPNLPMVQTNGKIWKVNPHKPTIDTRGVSPNGQLDSNRSAKGEIRKLRNTFSSKFFHLKGVETTSKQTENTLLKKSLLVSSSSRSAAVTPKGGLKLSKFDPSDINNFKFDFGDNQEQMQGYRDREAFKGKVTPSQSREASPRNIESLLCAVSPKNSNFFINRIRKNSVSFTTQKAVGVCIQEDNNDEGKSETLGKQAKSGRPTLFKIRKSPSVLSKCPNKMSNNIRQNSSNQKKELLLQDHEKLSKLFIEVGVVGRGLYQKQS